MSAATKQFCETSSMFEVGSIKNEAILRDFLHFWSWHHQKRSNSARLSHFFTWTASKTKQVCETSFKNGKLTVEMTASYQCILWYFHAMSLKPFWRIRAADGPKRSPEAWLGEPGPVRGCRKPFWRIRAADSSKRSQSIGRTRSS